MFKALLCDVRLLFRKGPIGLFRIWRNHHKMYTLMRLRTDIAQSDIRTIHIPFSQQGIVHKNWEFLPLQETTMRYIVVKVTIMPTGGEHFQLCHGLQTNDLTQAYNWSVGMSMALINNEIRIQDREAERLMPLSEVRTCMASK